MPSIQHHLEPMNHVGEADDQPDEHDQSYSHTRKQLLILGLFPLSEAIAWTSIFPYMYSMVESFSTSSTSGTSDASKANTATYAGLLVSVFTFGEFIMAPQWARISDRIGRKPTLIIGSIGAIISALMFGFSRSLPLAIAARLFAGLANPNLGVLKTFIGELVARDHQAKGFSLLPFLRGLGTIAGPVLGGYLAVPVENIPSLFRPGTVWERFPYLLPNLVVVLCLLISCALCFLFLEEVHIDFRGRGDVGHRISRGVGNLIRGRPWALNNNRSRGLYTALETAEGPESDTELADLHHERERRVQAARAINRRLAFTPQVCLQILSSAILGFLKIGTLASIPIFLATPHEEKHRLSGGLSLDTKATSNLLLLQAAASIVFQILVIPRVIETWGPVFSYQAALATLIVLYGLIPLSAALPGNMAIVTIVVALWVYALVNGVGSTCSAILLTNATPSREYLATINGVAASLGCLARTLGPMVLGPLFRLGIKVGFAGLPFSAMSLVAGGALVVAVFLRNHP